MRTEVASARRVVVKVGSSSLTGSDGDLSAEAVDGLVDAIAARRVDGVEIVLVSSGAIAAGLAPLGFRARPRDLATQQATASVGQGLLVERYSSSFARYDLRVGQVLLTADDVVRRTHYRNAHRTLTRLLDLGVVPVVNENDTVATDEIRFGDNDRLAALVAHLVHADLLVLLSDVDGLYDGDPRRGSATLISDIKTDADLAGILLGRPGRAGVGTGGMTTKVEAARIAAVAGIPAVLASAEVAGAALAGEPVGTHFHPTGRRAPTRLLWLAHASTPRGRLLLDGGAVAAVVERRLSLLPAGITAVEGSFSAGDPVDLLDENGHRVARGVGNYDSAELRGRRGRSTRGLAAEAGAAYA